MAGSLARVIADGVWTQHRKFEKGLVLCPKCLACKGTCTEANDTFIHRSLYCSKVEALGELEKFKWVKEIAAGYNEGRFVEFWEQWLKTGLRHPPCLPKPREDTQHETIGEVEPFHRCTIYLDGSTYNGKWTEVARAGWGLVVMEDVEGTVGGRENYNCMGTCRVQSNVIIGLKSMPCSC